MQLDYLLLADAVAVAEGKQYIHGAGWDTLFVSSVPAIHPVLGIAGRLRIPWEEANQPHGLEMDILAEETGDSIVPDPPGVLRGTVNIGHPPDVAPGSDQLLPLALTFTNLQFERSGAYAVVLRVDGDTLEQLRFHVTSLPGTSA